MSQPPELRAKPPCLRDDALAVLQRLRDSGHVAYFAGGCVRDVLLGITPADWDIATDAPPPRVRELFSSTQAVGQAFGVILVRHGRSVVEVATFRSDDHYLDGRRPTQVRFTTAEEDARRRDFTINGLLLDPVDNRVIDYVGGQADLRARIVRAIGQADHRFSEDHLRLLRAVRFAARFNFNIEADTAQAITRHAPLLKRISPERIADELRLMLTPASRVVAWKLLWTHRMVDVIFRFLSTPPAPLDPARSVFGHVAPGEPIPFGLAMAAGALDWAWRPIVSDADRLRHFERTNVQRMVRAMRQALRISNDESDQMRDTLAGLGPLLSTDSPRLAVLKRFLAQPTSPLSRDLLRSLRALGVCAARIGQMEQRFAELSGCDVAPPPLVSGDDLVAAGLAPGPAFKRILDDVYDAQLESRVADKPQAMSLALSLANTGRPADR